MNRDRRGYFYRSQRSGERVTREYLGKGAAAEYQARRVQSERAQVARERSKDAATRRDAAALASEVAGACDAIKDVVRAELQRHGYRQHARGQWRKQRMKQLQKAAPMDEREARQKQITALIPKARHDKKATAQLLELMEVQGITDGMARANDVAGQAELSIIKAFSGDDVFLSELHQRRLKTMRREMAGENPTALESLLAERIALCWFHVHLCEVTLAQHGEKMSLNVAAYQQKRLDGAHKRYLSAIKTLAEVRKMQLPNVQVNIGEKQVNVSG